MTDGLALDSTVLIDFRRRHEDARLYISGLIKRGAACTHPVCAAELLDGALDRADMQLTLEFLSVFKRLGVKSLDFETCLSLLSNLRLSHGIGWADCLVAATCLRLQMPLVTLNDKHFKAVHGLKVIRPY